LKTRNGTLPLLGCPTGHLGQGDGCREAVLRSAAGRLAGFWSGRDAAARPQPGPGLCHRETGDEERGVKVLQGAWWGWKFELPCWMF